MTGLITRRLGEQILVSDGISRANSTTERGKSWRPSVWVLHRWLNTLRKTILSLPIADDCQQWVQQLSREIRTAYYLFCTLPCWTKLDCRKPLRWYIQGLTERSGLDIRLTVADDFARLSCEMELVMFRLVQECLTNIHRHSGSKMAMIRLERRNDSIALEVRDEGKGIAPEKLLRFKRKARAWASVECARGFVSSTDR